MRRRDLLQAMAAATLAGCAPGSLTARATLATRTALFVPGYHPARVTPLGEPADSRRRARGGPRTLLTRIGADGSVRKAVFPVIGHDVAISPDGRVGFLGRMNLGGGEGAGHHVTFDPETLEMIAQGQATGPGWQGGGHGVFLPDGHILCSERAPARPWTGRAEAHHGRLSIRDPGTLAVIDSFSCHGIDPHELRLTEDGRQVVVATYASVPPATGTGPRWQLVAPSVTVLDPGSGRLVARYPVPDPEKELRHLALGRDGHILAIRAHQADPGQDAPWRRRIGAEVSETPVDPNPGVSYLPAAPLLLETGTGAVQELAGGEPRARLMEGLSVEYDPRHDQFLATFPSSRRLMVFAGDDGRVLQSLDLRDRGLVRPSGFALLPGPDLYVVAGYWQALHIHERGTHRTVHRLAQAPVTGGHSHMTAA